MPAAVMSPRRTLLLVAFAAAGAALCGCAGGGGAGGDRSADQWGLSGAAERAAEAPGVEKEAFTPGPVHQYTVQTIDGEEMSLDEFRGRTLLIVNVASACGMTPQYEQLEALWRSRRADGLVVLGFPSNDFNGQEPLDNEQIQAFCVDNYDVTFPMFAKAPVLGEQATPLFAELSRAEGAPSWNFTKYLVNPSGEVVARFEPQTSPMAPEVVERIDELLAGAGEG